MKKILTVSVLLFVLLNISSGDTTKHDWKKNSKNLPYPVANDPNKLTPLLEKELRGCFNFFWKEWVSDPSYPTYGMTCGDYVGMIENVPVAIEEQGFYFTTIVIGVDRGWIPFKEGYDRIVTTMKTLKNLKNFNGHYYHFMDRKTGKQGWLNNNIEITNVGTATMIAGALVAGEYFGGEVKKLADELYLQTNWKWSLDPVQQHYYLAGHPEFVPKGKKVTKEGFFGHWASYSEHIIIYILGAGAPNPEFTTTEKPYYKMIKYRGKYKGDEFIICGTGSAFTYQWTHCFVDFRNIVDKDGINWFENSKHAAIAARQFAIDKADEVKGLGPNSWGMSASISPTTGYSGHYGSHPIGAGYKIIMDGTVAPYGSAGFIPFTPKESIEAMEYMYTIPGLVGKYGLYDAYSFATKAKGDKPWTAETYLGIDKGIVSLMVENYSSQLIWKLFHQNKYVQDGLKKIGFTKTAN